MSKEKLHFVTISVQEGDMLDFDKLKPEIEEIEGGEADFSDVEKVVTSALQNLKKGKIKDADMDVAIAEKLHAALCHLDQQTLSDVRFWQWLTLFRFREFSETRIGVSVTSKLTREAANRFLGGESLERKNRQVLRRLFLACQTLAQASDYTLANEALSLQDTMVALFERNLGINHAVARAFVRGVKGNTGTVVQQKAKRLNAISNTTFLAGMPEAEIITMLK